MRILFLCVANSARSQMAEALAREIFKDQAVIQSAGSEPSKVNPFAIQALKEIGIDASSHTSKSVDSIDPEGIDYVITLCAEEVCPVFLSKAKKLHWPHKDPAGVDGSDEQKLESFREVRDQIKSKIQALYAEFSPKFGT